MTTISESRENYWSVRRAVRQMLEDSGKLRPFALALAQMNGWRCTQNPDECVRRTLRIFNSHHRTGHAPRNFDADWILLAVEITKLDYVSPMLIARAAESRLREEWKKSAMRTVPPRPSTGEWKRGIA